MLCLVVINMRLRVEIGSRRLHSDITSTVSNVTVLEGMPSYGNYSGMNTTVKYVQPDNYRSQLCVESFVFQLAIQKFKDYDIQNYNFACCFV
jgi:hypothetical protein